MISLHYTSHTKAYNTIYTACNIVEVIYSFTSGIARSSLRQHGSCSNTLLKLFLKHELSYTTIATVSWILSSANSSVIRKKQLPIILRIDQNEIVVIKYNNVDMIS